SGSASWASVNSVFISAPCLAFFTRGHAPRIEDMMRIEGVLDARVDLLNSGALRLEGRDTEAERVAPPDQRRMAACLDAPAHHTLAAVAHALRHLNPDKAAAPVEEITRARNFREDCGRDRRRIGRRDGGPPERLCGAGKRRRRAKGCPERGRGIGLKNRDLAAPLQLVLKRAEAKIGGGRDTLNF